MRLATIRTATGTRAVRVDDTQAVETGDADVRALLERTDWAAHAEAAAGPAHPVDGLDYAPLVPAPEKILCVGQNYRDHIAEMGNEPPAYPTIFAKFAPALVGAYDDIVLPSVSDAVDYEAELAVVIGRPVRHASPEQALAAVAGYTVLNDVSVRDWQFRTSAVPAGQDVRAHHPARAVPGHPGRAARGRLGDQHRDRRGDQAALGHGPARVRRRRSRRLPLDDPHPQPGRRHRHRDARGSGPRPQAPALPHRRRDDGDRDRRDRQLPQRVPGREPPSRGDDHDPHAEQALPWAADGAAYLRGMLTRMGDEAFAKPSSLPNWTRAHVLTHVARNADALINLLTWARTGVPTPPYSSTEQRNADIEAGAKRSPAEIRADLVASSDRLAAAVRGMPEEAWSARVDFRGRRILASDVLWLRAREVWIHAIDLDAGASFSDLPRPMLRELLTDAAVTMGARPEFPRLLLAPTDEPRTWTVGEMPAGSDGGPLEVRGPAAELVAWLLGRSKGRDLRTAEGPESVPHAPPARRRLREGPTSARCAPSSASPTDSRPRCSPRPPRRRPRAPLRSRTGSTPRTSSW